VLAVVAVWWWAVAGERVWKDSFSGSSSVVVGSSSVVAGMSGVVAGNSRGERVER
jgi:hypothetical protein